jgi:tripartite-type tricarboxylate transporter receptor subunit TctC
MRIGVITLTVVLALSAGVSAGAQTYPSKSIRLIVPTSAGGTTDLLGRMFANHIKTKIGAQVVVENRPGADGNIGMEVVAKAPPDGYTLALANTGHIAINPFIYKSMPYNPLKDLAMVGPIGEAPQLLVVNSSLPVKTLANFIALAKAEPGKINYGSAGSGSTMQLAADQFARIAGVSLVHVPYRGTTPAITDLIGGTVQMVSISLGPVNGYVEAGMLRVLIVAGKKRLALLPDVPTSAEAGVAGYEMATWFGLFAPSGTPKGIVDQLNGWIADMLADAETQKRLADNSVEQLSMRPDEFAKFIAAEAIKWEQAVRESGVPMQ